MSQGAREMSDPNQEALDEAVLKLLRAGTHDIVKVGAVPPWMERVPFPVNERDGVFPGRPLYWMKGRHESSPVVADGFPDRMPTGHDGSLDG